jgi:hypothetical protein
MVAIIDNSQTAYFYLQGPDRTNKTFLYKTLCHYYYGQGKIVLYMALTGIIALLLPDRHMSHSQFRILLELNKLSISIITKISWLRAFL